MADPTEPCSCEESLRLRERVAELERENAQLTEEYKVDFATSQRIHRMGARLDKARVADLEKRLASITRSNNADFKSSIGGDE